MASNNNVNPITTLSNIYTQYYKNGWANGEKGETPIIAAALNQIEMQLKEVYDAVGNIETADPESTMPLQSAVTNYKNSVGSRIVTLENKPVVTYTTTAEDYAAADEIVFVCGDAQPYIPN